MEATAAAHQIYLTIIITKVFVHSVMVEQLVIQAVISSVDNFNCSKIKLKSLIASMDNAAQVSGQNIFHIAFTKMVGSPFSLAHKLRDHLPHLTWKDFKSNSQESIQQNLSTVMSPKPLPICKKVLMITLRCTYIVPVNFHCKTDMPKVPVGGLNHYIQLYGQDFNKLREKVVGHQSTYWKPREDCFNNIHPFGAGYERVKGYYRFDFKCSRGTSDQ